MLSLGDGPLSSHSSPSFTTVPVAKTIFPMSKVREYGSASQLTFDGTPWLSTSTSLA